MSLLPFLLLTGACIPDSRLEVVILPSEPNTLDPLVAQVSGDEGYRLTWNWYRDGVWMSDYDGTQVPDTATSRDEIWVVQVTPTRDGRAGPMAEAQVTIVNSPPISLLTIQPSTPIAGVALTAYAVSADLDLDPVTLSWAWIQDGKLTPYTEAKVPDGVTSGHQIWEVQGIPSDGTDIGSLATASVSVPNRLPSVTEVTLTPSVAYEDTVLTASALAIDPDGDPVSYTWYWYVDGWYVLSGAESTLDGTWFDRDQEVYAKVYPFDDWGMGTGVSSSVVTIANTPPEAPVPVFDPPHPVAGDDDLVCRVASLSYDLDADVSSYVFSWTVDGRDGGADATSTLRTGDTIPGDLTHVGEQWICTVWPDDGDLGAPASVTVSPELPYVGWSQQEMDLDTVGVRLPGAHPGDRAGCAVAGAGDVDGDGRHDLLVGACESDIGGPRAGAGALLLGAQWGGISLADAVFTYYGETVEAEAGAALAGMGDADGDGLDDFAIGAPGNDGQVGAAYLVLSGDPAPFGEVSLREAALRMDGGMAGDRAGQALVSATDVDLDGLPDLWVGSPGADAGAGGAWLYAGAERGVLDPSDALCQVRGASGDGAGAALASGDMDGDGFDDLMVGAPHNPRDGREGGAVYRVSSSLGLFDLDLDDADAIYLDEAGSMAGSSLALAGDVDGDGLTDLLAGAPGARGVGAAYLVPGGYDSGPYRLSSLDCTLLGDEDGGLAGASVAGPGDLDGDHLADVWLGSPAVDGGRGAAWLVLGSVLNPCGILDPTYFRFAGGSLEDEAGISVAGPGDVDGDGIEDLLVGGNGMAWLVVTP